MALSAYLVRWGRAVLLPAALLAAAEAPRREVGSEIEKALAPHRAKGLVAGIVVRPADGGDPVVAIEAARQFKPASNMKLFTTGCGLKVLGPGYTFSTRLYRLRNGARDDYVLVGGGDPNLSGRWFQGRVTHVFEAWAKALRDRGEKGVNGSLLVDDRLFDREFVHRRWPADQAAEWYSAPVGGLVFNDSCLNLTIGPGPAAGADASIAVEPAAPCLNVVRRLKTTGESRRHKVVIARPPGTNDVRVDGLFYLKAPPAEEFVAVKDPGIFAGCVLKDVFARNGLPIAGGVARVPDDFAGVAPETKPIAEFRSRLSQAVEVANRRSQNLYAEQIFKLLGREVAGDGSFRGGASAVSTILVRDLGLPADEIVVSDGSGLSDANRATPNALALFLVKQWQAKDREVFCGSLAVPGGDGSIRKRLLDEPYRSSVRAKTGHIAGADALSGYARGRSGREWAFVMLMDHGRSRHSVAEVRALEDRICRLLVDGL